jgi:predicted DNA binding CopG/RHH family protein
MLKGVQFFSQAYLDQCAKMTPDQILEFLENYRLLISTVPEKCQLISLKVEPSLLKAFEKRAQMENIPYQTLIKKLMRQYIS